MILYGTSKSRAARSLVMLEELGLAYDHVPVFAPDRDRASDRALLSSLNPNGHVPVLDDQGFHDTKPKEETEAEEKIGADEIERRRNLMRRIKNKIIDDM